MADESPVQRSFGWSRQLPDFRDFFYQMPMVKAMLPPAVDLTAPSPGHPFDPDLWDQGTLGSCGPNTAAENLVFDQLKTGAAVMPSRLFIYYNARALMNTVNSDSGVDNRSMLKSLAGNGWCDETMWPYDIGRFKEKPGMACYNQAATRKAGIVYMAVPQSLEQMKGCLAEGFPFVFGFSVYSSMLTQAVDQSGDIPMPRASDRLEGGHDVLIVGYDDVAQRFKLKNHWGNWGKAGYGTIPYSYATNAGLAGDFWTVRAAGGEPVPPPTPPPASNYRLTLESNTPIRVVTP